MKKINDTSLMSKKFQFTAQNSIFKRIAFNEFQQTSTASMIWIGIPVIAHWFTTGNSLTAVEV